MSSNSSSSAQPNFIHPEDFTQNIASPDGWFCNLCVTPNSESVNSMTLKEAQEHERGSSEHEIHRHEEIESHGWDWTPANDWAAPLEPLLTTAQMKLRNDEMDLCLAQDIVPFWIRGVEAAKRGKVLRLEEFLEKLQNTWTRNVLILHGEDKWDEVAEGGWGPEGWRDRGEERIERKAWEGKKNQRARRRNKRPWRATQGIGKVNMEEGGKAYDFVEVVAKQEAADEERRQRMHNFYEMPTNEKIRKIGEVIKELVAAH